MADEYDIETPRDTPREHDTVERTTIVNTDSGSGSGGVMAVILLLLAVGALLYLFRDQLGLSGHKTTEVKIPDKININVN
jgi:hypothetical protein